MEEKTCLGRRRWPKRSTDTDMNALLMGVSIMSRRVDCAKGMERAQRYNPYATKRLALDKTTPAAANDREGGAAKSFDGCASSTIKKVRVQ